jgi:prepilin-type N-terminal cleavage/methylation domain-containing protein
MEQSKRSKKAHTDKGFTVIELLVTLAIVVLVTGIVMIRYSSFNSSVLLTSQAYITGFDVRETQSLAISVRGNSNQFREEYGMYFDINTPTSYLLFQDNNDNGNQSPVRYQSGEEIGAPYKVDPRFKIMNLCVSNSSGRTCRTQDASTSGTESTNSSLTTIALAFRRPDFDAELYSPAVSNLTSVEIHFGNDNITNVKKVIVYSSGQISVE